MTILSVSYYMLSVISSLLLAQLFYKIHFINSMSAMGIFKESYTVKHSNGRMVLYIILLYSYLFMSTLIYSNEYIENFKILNLIWLLSLVSFTLIIPFYMLKLSYKKENLTKFALKQTTVSEALVDFLVDSFRLSNNGGSFLYDYKVSEKATEKESEYLNGLQEKYNISTPEGIFPLNYIRIVFKITLNKYRVTNSPIITSYIIENITFISTIMTILNDKHLVESLSSKLGFSELLDLTREFEELYIGLKKLIDFEIDEKKRFAESQKSIKALDGLNTVRSMREINQSIK